MNVLKRLFGRGCVHRFSWPRMDSDGRYYQTCPNCGITYEYDWKMMRRTAHLLPNDGSTTTAGSHTPRAHF